MTDAFHPFYRAPCTPAGLAIALSGQLTRALAEVLPPRAPVCT